ncbi:Major facilitator superfamily domain-containing protein 4A [Halotydeus destructor]|nr:Major facilitator superfamily domain-containing protein 4A [Halotydeus destructor]
MADTRFVIYLKSVSLCLAFVNVGSVVSIIGPTILELQCAIDVSYENVVKIMPARASGYVLGAFIVGVLYDRLNPLLTVTVTLTTTGLCAILMPFATSLVGILATAFVSAIGSGIICSCCNVFILYIWGKESQPYMQALNFAFGVGGLVAPLLASPFLTAREIPIEGLARNMTSVIRNDCNPEELLIHIPYAILGASCLLTAILFLYLFCFYRETEEHHSRRITSKEKVAAGGGKNFLWTKTLAIALAAMFLFTLLGFEIGMGSFIMSFAVKSDLHLTKQVGAYMTSLYWAMFTFFRLVAILLIDKIGMYRNIAMELGILVLANVFLVPFGNSVEWCLWVGVSLAGIGISSLWGAIFVLLETHFPVTSGIAASLTVSACVGEWVFPVIMGYALEANPQLFLWVILACTALCCVLFSILSFLLLTRLAPEPEGVLADDTTQGYLIKQCVPVPESC